MLGASFDYQGELDNAKMRLQKQKEKLKLRAMIRRGEFSGQEQQDPLKAVEHSGGGEGNDSESMAGGGLPQMIARFLLGQEISLPLDSQALQNKLSTPEWEAQYQQALTAAGNPTLDQVLSEMAQTELPGIKVGEIEVGGKKRTSVLQIDRARLAGLAGDLAFAGGPGPEPGPGLPPPPGPGNVPGPRPPPMGNFPMPGMHPGQYVGPPVGQPFNLGVPGGFNLPGVGQGFGSGPHAGNYGPGGMMGPGPGMGPPPGMGPHMSHMGPPPGMAPGMLDHPAMGHPGPPMGMGPGSMMFPRGPPAPPPGPAPPTNSEDLLESLLKRPTAAQRDKTGKGEELHKILQAPTAAEKTLVKQFQNAGGPAVRGVCPKLTKADCCRANMSPYPCKQVHFRPVIFPWTNPAKGNCSFLDTCRNLHRCDHIHYELDDDMDASDPISSAAGPKKPPVPTYLQALPEPQWLNVDIRSFDMSVLGKFGVVMADPPWEIHQDLPYGTMDDQEMREMRIGDLQDDGVIFLWVTGRAMELGRECLEKWGYNRVDELIWVKTNQLHRLIRTGRTGHWLNHSKEHCLVGIKGNPSINRNIECDVVVSEVRQTSRKPDEMYGLLERISPGTRKVEIFARPHNLKPGWVSLGNQLPGIKIVDPDMLARYEARYGPITEAQKAEAADFDPSTIPP